MNRNIKIIPLGGVGEIGKNMTVIEYEDDMIVIDCGMSFPDESMPGIDVVIPDITYIKDNLSKLRGILITHGHEDHIGALPYLYPEMHVPVYGTAFTVALIEHKFEENHIDKSRLNVIIPGDRVQLGCFNVEFIKTGHSIAGAVAMAINTPVGTIIHTGDFKVDLTPIDKEPIDLKRFAFYGSRGALCLMSDSTNIERQGHTPSEMDLGGTFEKCFDSSDGRIIVASFASNVYRIQQIADIAIKHGRYLCFQGRSMEQIVQIGIRLSYLNIPAERIIPAECINKYKDNQICVITTGSQGEVMSGLFRMASSSHNKVEVKEGDLVIISASAIPGNEKDVSRIINLLYKKGCNVVYDRMADVHVSGHACKEELRLMLDLIHPKFFIPVHGEYRHLYMHGQLAEEMGIPRKRVFIADCGDTIEINKKNGRISGSVSCGSVMVDGLGDIDDIVLKDRKMLANDGVVVTFLTLDVETGRVLAEPQIISRGFVYMRESDDLIAEMNQLVLNESLKFQESDKEDYQNIKNSIRSKLKSFIKSKTQRNPMVIFIVQEI